MITKEHHTASTSDRFQRSGHEDALLQTVEDDPQRGAGCFAVQGSSLGNLRTAATAGESHLRAATHAWDAR